MYVKLAKDPNFLKRKDAIFIKVIIIFQKHIVKKVIEINLVLFVIQICQI